MRLSQQLNSNNGTKFSVGGAGKRYKWERERERERERKRERAREREGEREKERERESAGRHSEKGNKKYKKGERAR